MPRSYQDPSPRQSQTSRGKNNPTQNHHPSTPEKPLEVMNAPQGAMMDNIWNNREQHDLPDTPPQEFLQAKLTIGAVGDRYEQEADFVAKDVVAKIHAPQESPIIPPRTGESLQRKSLIPIDDRISTTETESSLQCKAEAFQQLWQPILPAKGEAVGSVSEAFEGDLKQATGGGQPLDKGLQQKMGETMGADLSGVNIHTDSRADRLSQTIQAKAFTTGKDIFFKQGEYQPNSKGGQELIAHELTHTMQQGGMTREQKPLISPNTVGDNLVQRTIEIGIENNKKEYKEDDFEDLYKESKSLIDSTNEFPLCKKHPKMLAVMMKIDLSPKSSHSFVNLMAMLQYFEGEISKEIEDRELLKMIQTIKRKNANNTNNTNSTEKKSKIIQNNSYNPEDFTDSSSNSDSGHPVTHNTENTNKNNMNDREKEEFNETLMDFEKYKQRISENNNNNILEDILKTNQSKTQVLSDDTLREFNVLSQPMQQKTRDVWKVMRGFHTKNKEDNSNSLTIHNNTNKDDDDLSWNQNSEQDDNINPSWDDVLNDENTKKLHSLMNTKKSLTKKNVDDSTWDWNWNDNNTNNDIFDNDTKKLMNQLRFYKNKTEILTEQISDLSMNNIALQNTINTNKKSRRINKNKKHNKPKKYHTKKRKKQNKNSFTIHNNTNKDTKYNDILRANKANNWDDLLTSNPLGLLTLESDKLISDGITNKSKPKKQRQKHFGKNKKRNKTSNNNTNKKNTKNNKAIVVIDSKNFKNFKDFKTEFKSSINSIARKLNVEPEKVWNALNSLVQEYTNSNKKTQDPETIESIRKNEFIKRWEDKIKEKKINESNDNNGNSQNDRFQSDPTFSTSNKKNENKNTNKNIVKSEKNDKKIIENKMPNKHENNNNTISNPKPKRKTKREKQQEQNERNKQKKKQKKQKKQEEHQRTQKMMEEQEKIAKEISSQFKHLNDNTNQEKEYKYKENYLDNVNSLREVWNQGNWQRSIWEQNSYFGPAKNDHITAHPLYDNNNIKEDVSHQSVFKGFAVKFKAGWLKEKNPNFEEGTMMDAHISILCKVNGEIHRQGGEPHHLTIGGGFHFAFSIRSNKVSLDNSTKESWSKLPTGYWGTVKELLDKMLTKSKDNRN